MQLIISKGAKIDQPIEQILCYTPNNVSEDDENKEFTPKLTLSQKVHATLFSTLPL
jgi:hypothetical protein